LEPILQQNSSEHDIRVPLFERENDQIAHAPDIIIAGLLNALCTGSEWLVHWGCDVGR